MIIIALPVLDLAFGTKGRIRYRNRIKIQKKEPVRFLFCRINADQPLIIASIFHSERMYMT